MNKIGVFYGSTTGTTEDLARRIAEKLDVPSAHIYDVSKLTEALVGEYDVLVLGSSTWGAGELQDDWYDGIKVLKKCDLSHKYVALFGCGDSDSYSDTFCDAIGILYEELKGACPLKEEIADRGFDLMIMRELTGGLYFGERKTIEENGVKKAIDTLSYNENEIRRIAIKAFDIAMKRRKKVTSVDKANVLDSSRLWRKVVEEVAKDYPEVTLEHMLVDNCAMQLVRDPKQFDVILTENMFGDILSDEASMVTGSIGMLSSASLNESKFGLYEPSHGSAPDIAGKDIANPIATILSAAMMLRYSFDLDKEAKAIEDAVQQVLTEGYRTVDIMADGCKQVGTVEMGRLICERIR